MRKIAVTLPGFFAGEAVEIARLIGNGDYWRVHIRKPGASAEQIRALLQQIPAELYPRLSLHDHHELALQFGLGGVHLNRRNPQAPAGWNGLVSRSLHSPEEIASMECDYAFLSPIYPSVSKPGYKPDFDLQQLRGVVDERVFALGGVTPDKFDELRDIGFGGAAMLGYVWKPAIDIRAFGLQFITHAPDHDTMAGQVEKVLAGGCRWVQLRHKSADRETLIREGNTLRALCDSYGATFIIDDHVDLVNIVGADGVHLGKNDMSVGEARAMLGIRKIIGATANTFEDIAKAVREGADYIGLGPYRFTTTKEKLSPVLGLHGYRNIATRCHEAGIAIPIVAIGGIELDDISPIIRTGVNGIAVSGTIRNASDPIAMTREIIGKLKIGN